MISTFPSPKLSNPNGASEYPASYKYDANLGKYIFTKTFTRVNGSENFAMDYSIDGNSVIANTYLNSNSSNICKFEFEEK